jgi:D-glycero-alpha-D-manno-heptose-7-phosphate kinase
MIIARVPFRISFFGGGSDIPSFFMENGGQVISTTINKYCYVTARSLPPFFDHSIRLAYSKVEMCKRFDEINHPLIRAALADYERNNIEIHYDSDLPGNSGLGSSSSFGVGLAICLSGLEGRLESKRKIAERVIHWERNVLDEAGGFQDQIAASFGGFNRIRFSTTGDFAVEPLLIERGFRKQMQERMVLCHIPKPRFSGDVSVARHMDKSETVANLQFIRDTVDEAMNLIYSKNLDGIGELLHESWLRKREFAGVSDPDIDALYEAARDAGALGGKLLGAGGGGFMLIWCAEGTRKAIESALAPRLVIPFDFDSTGGQTIYFHD